MREDVMEVDGVSVPMRWVHTLVIGSGAAGLNAAVQLRAGGVEDVVILTEGLDMGTSINTGSDKQTYYKLSMCGADPDAPATMAETYLEGGSMHGDLALVEASLSARAFVNLVNLGVPFPRDAYGQFIGYKTDHDPRQRATSIGPYTSREMCRALIREVKRLGVPVMEKHNVVQLLVLGEDGEAKRAAGAIAVDEVVGITSLSSEKGSAKQLLEWTRGLWGIENGLHYRRDVTLNEDGTRMTNDNLAEAMAVLNNFVIGLTSKLGFRNLASAQRVFDAKLTLTLSSYG